MTEPRSAAPSVAQIADHWVSLAILADGSIVEHGDERWAGGYHPVVDTHEVSCFACGWWSERDKGVRGPRGGEGLERAHAVPHASGGSNSPENLALLCPTCHAAAPDTADAPWFWSWIARHSRDGTPWHVAVRRANEMQRLIPDGRRAEALQLALFSSDKITEMMMRAAADLGAVHHGGKFSAATLVRVYLRAAEMLTEERRQAATPSPRGS